MTSSLCVLGWVEGEFQMTSVTSTRELRPVPKMLIEMVKDPSSLNVIYHGPGNKDQTDSTLEVGSSNVALICESSRN